MLPPTAPRRLPVGLRCGRCGYNLFGSSTDGLCPECGTPVADTTSNVSYADPAWLAGVLRGIPLLLGGLLCLSALLALVALDLRSGWPWGARTFAGGAVLEWAAGWVPIETLFEDWGLPNFNAPAYWYAQEEDPARFAHALWMLAPAVCGAAGLWLVARPQAATFAREGRAARRRAVRLLAGTAGAGVALAAAAPLLRDEPGVLWTVVFVAFLLNALQVPAAVLALLHLRGLAARLGVRRRRLAVAAALAAPGLGFFALAAAGYILQVYWVDLPAGVGGFVDRWRPAACLAGSAALGGMALALVGLRRRLGLAARGMRATLKDVAPPTPPPALAALAVSARRWSRGTAAAALLLTIAGAAAWRVYRGPGPLRVVQTGGPRQRFAFCPDGRHVLASPLDAYEDPALYDVESGAVVRRFDAGLLATPARGGAAPLGSPPKYYGGLAVSADGSRAAFCAPDAVVVWERATGREVCRLREPEAMYCPLLVALSPDGRQVAWIATPAWMGSPPGRNTAYDFALRLCSAEAGAAPAVVNANAAGPLLTLAFSPDSKRLLAVQFAPGGPAHLIDVASRREIARAALWPCQFANGVAFAPDGRGVLMGYDKVYRWDAVSQGSAPVLEPDGGGFVAYLAVSPDGRRVLGSGRRRLWLWDLASGRLVATFRRPRGASQVAFSPDGRRALAADNEDGAVSTWELPP